MTPNDFVIDAHQHIWDPRLAPYPWLLESLAPINRPIGFDEVRPSLRRAGVDATILVQSADNHADTQIMLDAADAHPEITAIVAFAPLQDAAATAAWLDAVSDNPLIVGIRNLIHDMSDPDWIIRDDVAEGLSELERRGMTFDYVAVLPRHLEHIPTLSERHPQLRIVIDHLGKPPIGLNDIDPWTQLIGIAAENPNVYGKISGLYSAKGQLDHWTAETLRPHFYRAVEVFGAERLMYGGDWPISILAGGYDKVWDGLCALIGELGTHERRQILGSTAQNFYRLNQSRLSDSVAYSRSGRHLAAGGSNIPT